ncbi:cytochrome bd-I oxidase subunit CydX [Sideroxydans lithotrophicus]|uniref:Cyd operon protein YbgT n=1 Tax=Sideroxydans lithotrophicus (strain ES-1) TaxID=580332 RepID=D5CR01_SIDLE|nr:cytochrome bd-I oxidase subunit CydX [Sideroxydans lithotrophicus]ADE11387.1 cyd operon protein YbgT [Sideroxydans lithotrophicus ES-1]
MWYFAWILGVSMAILLAIVNTMMCDAQACVTKEESSDKE